MFSEEEKTAERWLKEIKKGYIRIAVLILLSEKPYHGYELMRKIKERTMGFWRPTAGGIYPILRDLEKLGYVEGEWDSQKKRKRKTYAITETGRLVLERAVTKENQITDRVRGLFREYMKDVLDVETEPSSMPRLPTPFSVFMEERRERPEDTVNVLEGKRMQIQNMIGELQKQSEAIDKRLSQLKKQ